MSNQSSNLVTETSILRGKRVLLLGGDPRPNQREAIERELGLANLRWVETRSTTSLSRLSQIVAHEDCEIVIIALRWARYRFSGLVRTCSVRGIPFLRLPGGINPAQIAHQARQQVSQRLGRAE